MNKKKGIKYYALIFFMSIAALLIYTLMLYFTSDVQLTFTAIYPLFFIPVMFTGLVFVFDLIFDRVLPQKWRSNQVKRTEYDDFLDQVNKVVNEQLTLSLEDSRRLRDNQRFQKALSQAFSLNKHGESETLSWAYLEKKFKKDTNEYMALQVVIEMLKK